MKNIIRGLDTFLFSIINKKFKNKFFDRLFPIYTNLGGLWFIISFNIILVFLFKGKIRYTGLQMALSLALSQAITYYVKAKVKRERPYNVLTDINTYGFYLRDHSFPSGHSSASFTVAMTIWFSFPNIGLFALIIAFFIAISRIYLGVHYGTDVIVGILLGLASSILVEKYLLFLVDRLYMIFL